MDDVIANIIITVSLAVLLGTFLLAVCSVFHSLKVNKRRKTENGVPVGVIGWMTFLALLMVSIPLLLFASFTDMCIITALVMLALSVGCIIYSMAHSATLRKKR
ncbi:MAG: hypothetical protein IJV10_02220 [Prevotella sp.]|nr:hypothetical protein [Prevotella sp.]MBR1840456.1 hypothetical protein [Prevotella sp.]